MSVITASDLEPYIEREFGLRLAAEGFCQVAKRTWVRSAKLPIREIFRIYFLGARYTPCWGISSGIVPALHGNGFRRQQTDKSAVMDLVIDPIDITGEVPKETFSFIPGLDMKVPKEEIKRCAKHFVPLALADFDRVKNLREFFLFFRERSKLKYRRFEFDMRLNHVLTLAFIELYEGRSDEGLRLVRAFCKTHGFDYRDKVLAEYIRALGQKPESFSGI